MCVQISGDLLSASASLHTHTHIHMESRSCKLVQGGEENVRGGRCHKPKGSQSKQEGEQAEASSSSGKRGSVPD